jgi:hypothetical protein
LLLLLQMSWEWAAADSGADGQSVYVNQVTQQVTGEVRSSCILAFWQLLRTSARCTAEVMNYTAVKVL